MKKSELKEMIKAAFMAENQGEQSADDILASLMGTDKDPYMAEEKDMDEMVSDLYEAEDEEVDVDVDAEEEIDGGDEEVDVKVDVDAEEEAPANDSIVVDKKIVSLSSLPGKTRKILDTLETLRAEAEEFGDQKFITQVGNTITFFTRDFVVAGDAPNPAGIEEDYESADTKMEAELELESLNEIKRMQKLAGIITENDYKTKTNEITKGVTSADQIDSFPEFADKLLRFSQQPEIARLLDKFQNALGAQGIEAIEKSVSSVNENDLDPKDLEGFLRKNVKMWAPKLKDKTPKINEDIADIADELTYKVADFVRGFSKVNILSMGMLPLLTGAAIEYFGGPEVVTKAVDIIGDPTAATGISVLATMLGSVLVWKLADMATGEETDLI